MGKFTTAVLCSTAKDIYMLEKVKRLMKKHKSKIDLVLGLCYIIGVPYYVIGIIYIAKYFI